MKKEGIWPMLLNKGKGASQAVREREQKKNLRGDKQSSEGGGGMVSEEEKTNSVAVPFAA